MPDESENSAADRESADAPTIHIVDDDPRFLKSLSRLLRVKGFRVAEFQSAQAFLLHHRDHPSAPGCVILDLNLPGVNGLEVQELIAHDEDPLPVVFLTGQGDVPSSAQAMKGAAVDFLMKPVHDQDLVSALQRALARGTEARKANSQL